MLPYILLAILPFLAIQNTKTMEKAIINGNFSYVQNSLKNGITSESKEVYLEIANKQLTLATNRSKSWIPNKWDAIALGTSVGLVALIINNLKNSPSLFKEAKKSYELVDKFCNILVLNHMKKKQIINLNCDKDSIPEEYKLDYEKFYYRFHQNFINMYKDDNSLETRKGNLSRSICELPKTKIYTQVISISIESVLAFWLLNKAYYSYYKNLDFKNRVAIKHLIENAQINENPITITSEKSTIDSIKEKFGNALSQAKSDYLNLKNKSNEILNELKLKIKNIDKQKVIKAAISGTVSLATTALLIQKLKKEDVTTVTKWHGKKF